MTNFSTVSAETAHFSKVSSPQSTPPRPLRITAEAKRGDTSGIEAHRLDSSAAVDTGNTPDSVSTTVSSSAAPPKTIGPGEFSGQPQPLGSGGLAVYEGSEPSAIESGRPDVVYGEIKTAEFQGSEKASADAVKPAGFKPNGLNPRDEQSPLHISLDDLNLTDDQSLALFNRLTNSIGQGIETTKQSVVHIEAKVRKEKTSGPREMEETGSGIIIKTKRGDFYVITNDHVAGNAVSENEVSITLYDRRILHPVSVRTCPDFDIAVLKLAEKDLTPATLGNSDQVREIDSVLAIGSPFGLEGSVTSGIVSGLNRRQIPLGNDKQVQGFIQTDASINPGNSGGPLVNIRGEVIGIMIAIASKNGENTGVSFAIPINNAIHVAEQLIKDGVYQRPYIGVKLDMKFDAMEKIAAGLLLDPTLPTEKPFLGKRAAGTRVRGVIPDSPAALAGLREGDIILRYNHQVVEDEGHFENLISLSKVDEIPTLEILRDNKRYEIKPKLAGRDRTLAQKNAAPGNY